jgi:hypothetical protein
MIESKKVRCVRSNSSWVKYSNAASGGACFVSLEACVEDALEKYGGFVEGRHLPIVKVFPHDVSQV